MISTTFDDVAPVTALVLGVETGVFTSPSHANAPSITSITSLLPTPTTPPALPSPTSPRTDSPEPASIQSNKSAAVIRGGVGGGVGGALLLFLTLLTCWWAKRRGRRQLSRVNLTTQETISPFIISKVNNNSTRTVAGLLQTSLMPQQLVLGIGRSKYSEMRDPENMIVDAQEELHATPELVDRGSGNGVASTQVTTPLEQRVAEILERVRRMEELVNNHPPDYQSQPGST
ncbi:hypothetical protein BDP27DRAFT_1451814 [Rhodocollybia butyracea]|uniref:Transmembrane protein n=1 Tax=Rhodocollybia butyracea TaxID=206335 RepID=A0A9P5PHQ8_9AGAR|nr:hypothetical protein BDP27DRAFT_1451814 [Rhodocollybia butyracea]